MAYPWEKEFWGIGTGSENPEGFDLGDPFRFTLGSEGLDIWNQKGEDAAKEAAQIQAEYGQKALDLQESMYKQGREDMMPWLTAGKESLGTLQGMMAQGAFDAPKGGFKFGQEDFERTPYYDFLQKEGARNVKRSRAGTGMTGGTLAALQQRGQDIAGQYFDKERDFGYRNFLGSYGRKMDKYNRIANMAGMGQIQSSQMGGIGQGYGSQAGQSLTGIGNVLGAGQIGAANARQQGTHNLLNLGGQIGGAMIMGSDRRLKKNIIKIGKHKGLNSYLFQYIKKPGWFIGAMADEVKKIIPEAVINIGGYDHVNYGVLNAVRS